jgi:hypothetical protein
MDILFFLSPLKERKTKGKKIRGKKLRATVYFLMQFSFNSSS